MATDQGLWTGRELHVGFRPLTEELTGLGQSFVAVGPGMALQLVSPISEFSLNE